jgi:uncharacterized membrane protein YfhO
MNKQRIAIMLCALTGMFAVFMPWAHTIIPGLKSLNGMSKLLGRNGWYILFMFAIPFILSLSGKHSRPLKKIPLYIAVIPAVAAIIAVFIEMIRFKYGNWIQVKIASLGFGLYVIIIAGILLTLSAFILKGKKKE